MRALHIQVGMAEELQLIPERHNKLKPLCFLAEFSVLVVAVQPPLRSERHVHPRVALHRSSRHQVHQRKGKQVITKWGC